MLDARFSHLYFCHSLNGLQRGLSAIAEPLGHYRRLSVELSLSTKGKISVSVYVVQYSAANAFGF